jgi:hypothetical protein
MRDSNPRPPHYELASSDFYGLCGSWPELDKPLKQNGFSPHGLCGSWSDFETAALLIPYYESRPAGVVQITAAADGMT